MRTLLSCAIIILVACAEPASPSPRPETIGGEVEEQAPPAPTPTPVSPPTGPSHLTVRLMMDGQITPGRVEIIEVASGEVEATGESDQTFTLPAGDYSVRGQIADASVLIDRPTHLISEPGTLSPGEQRTVDVTFDRSRVRIRVLRNGQRVPRWSLELEREGGDGPPLTLSPSEELIPISSGRYNGVVVIGNERIEVSGLLFMSGAQQTIPININ